MQGKVFEGREGADSWGQGKEDVYLEEEHARRRIHHKMGGKVSWPAPSRFCRDLQKSAEVALRNPAAGRSKSVTAV